MKSSIVLASLCATATMAGPYKRGLHTEWVYETVTVTVTGGVEPTTLPVTPSAPAAGQFFDAGDAATTPVPVPSVNAELEPQPEPEPVLAPAPTPEPVSSPLPVESTPVPVSFPKVSSDYQEAALQYHNVHRANHSAADLVWSTDLADRANLIVLGCTGQHVMNQGPNDYGQNLQAMSTPKDAPAAMGTSWYNNEVNNYHYYGQEPPEGEVTKWGHFTAMVWASTKEVGCATAWCDSFSWTDDKGRPQTKAFNNYWTICNYKPVGNMGGAYSENVLPPKGEATFL